MDFPTGIRPRLAPHPQGERGINAEWESLSRETNSEIFNEGMLVLGERAERSGNLETAAHLYASVSFSNYPAQQRLDVLTGSGPAGPRAEFLLRRLARETIDPTLLFGLSAASAAFRLTRFATGAWSHALLRPSAAVLVPSGALGFGAEAMSFPLATRLAAMALGRDLDWNPETVGRELASSFILLGALRLTGSAVGRVLQPPAGMVGARPVLHQAAMLGGILIGHHLEEWLGLRPAQVGTTRLVESLALLLQFHVAGRLAAATLGNPWALRELELRRFYLESAPVSPRRSWMASSEGSFALAPAAPFSPPLERTPGAPRISSILMMGGEGDNDGNRPKGPGDNVIPFRRIPRGSGRDRNSSPPPEPESTPTQQTRLIQNFARNQDPAFSREILRTRLQEWLSEIPIPRFIRETEYLEGRLEQIPEYFQNMLGYYARFRPSVAKLLLVQLNLVHPDSTLRRHNEVSHAMENPAIALVPAEIVQHVAEQSYARFQSAFMRYFPARSGELTQEFQDAWYPRVRDLPAPLLDCLMDPLMGDAQFLYLADQLGLGMMGYPRAE